jgi:protein TonB
MGIFYPAFPAAGRQSRPDTHPTASLVAVVALHAAALFLLAAFVPAERLNEIIRPLAVRLIELAPEAPPPPPPEPPKPRPMPKASAAPPILAVATPTPAPSPVEFVVPPQPPAPPVAVAPTPTYSPKPTPSAPAPVILPRFDADYLNNPKPVYPSSSRRLGEEGKVVLRVHVTPEGHSGEIELKSSSGFSRLDKAARDAVAQWRFVPARRGDEPIAAWVLVPIVFSLES